MALFYPDHLRERFTNRVRELAFLANVVEDLKSRNPSHVALFGLRRIGKTLLAQEQVKRLRETSEVTPVYLDMQALCTSPESFAQRYIGLTSYWVFAGGRGPADSYLTADRLLETEAATIPPVAQTLGSLIREQQKNKADQSLLIQLALDFPGALAQALNRPIMCFLDEFPELATLSNFPRVGDPIRQFRASLQQQSHVAYVITGSAVTVMERLVRDHESPLFLQFRTLELQPFTPEDTVSLVERLFPGLSPKIHATIYTYTFGHPFYVTALTNRLRQLVSHDPDVEVEEVERAFILETLSRQGQIYGYCRYLYDISLQKARGYGLLKALLQVLAEEDGLKLSEIARRLHRQPPAVREYLRWLAEVDLIVENDKLYYYRDPLLRFWVAYTGKGMEIDAFPQRDTLEGLVADLSERFQRAATQLGMAKESEVRELLRNMAGEEIDGTYFGRDTAVRVPAFDQVTPYTSPDGQIELDALAEGTKTWVVEVKWRRKRVGSNELERLQEHAASFDGVGWCVSQSGFTPEAVSFASQYSILISDADDLKALSKRYRTR